LLAIVKDIDVAYSVEVLHYLRLLLGVLRGALSEISVCGGTILLHSSHCRHESLTSKAARRVLFITKSSMSSISTLLVIMMIVIISRMLVHLINIPVFGGILI
jgi:hypothetical protein